ncbi:hypothetical protein [Halobiforma nitratireducens]|uniref:Uncharacterized protein n=1 Tax=Halobiforma nitratireducens JCM 10879 TaxID=1227454 RepID=M0M3E8_9EURY|nr:hypothetical protein [Halobiforma nitratireducens]EMA39124.1 hypothetical protein C446_09038 [Halobiforma nitratireducens JCM 10879]
MCDSDDEEIRLRLNELNFVQDRWRRYNRSIYQSFYLSIIFAGVALTLFTETGEATTVDSVPVLIATATVFTGLGIAIFIFTARRDKLTIKIGEIQREVCDEYEAVSIETDGTEETDDGDSLIAVDEDGKIPGGSRLWKFYLSVGLSMYILTVCFWF